MNFFLRILLGALLVLSLPAEARPPWRANADNTRGWSLMSPEERLEHQAQIRSFRTLADCEAYREQHHRLMNERAQAAGKQLTGGGHDFCADFRGAANPPQRSP